LLSDIEGVESEVGCTFSTFWDIHVSDFVDAPPTAGRSNCRQEHVYCDARPSFSTRFMPLTTFLELGHLFPVFNVVRARRYPFQADLDDATAL
jgi:hypothetical protein